jgi:hypothetical protein
MNSSKTLYQIKSSKTLVIEDNTNVKVAFITRAQAQWTLALECSENLSQAQRNAMIR